MPPRTCCSLIDSAFDFFVLLLYLLLFFFSSLFLFLFYSHLLLFLTYYLIFLSTYIKSKIFLFHEFSGELGPFSPRAKIPGKTEIPNLDMQKNKESDKLNTDLEKLKSVLYEISAQKEKLEKENKELNNKIIRSETNGISMVQKGKLN